MAHPFQKFSAEKVGRERASAMCKAAGGKAHSDAAADKKLFGKLMKEHEKKEMKAEGKKSGGRLDKFARGGRTKKGAKTNVNIVIASKDKDQGGPPMPLPIPAGGPPGLPPPPMRGAIPPGGPGPGPGLPTPPPMAGGPRPPMKRGGKVGYKTGGKVKYTGGAETGVGRKQKAARYSAKG